MRPRLGTRQSNYLSVDWQTDQMVYRSHHSRTTIYVLIRCHSHAKLVTTKALRRTFLVALHGRALSRNDRPSSFKRPLSPAIKPGEQPFGAAHPLSPTNMGSPPRRHRNSNWGEEGMRLAEEEETNARQTVPFVVSGTLLGSVMSVRRGKELGHSSTYA